MELKALEKDRNRRYETANGLVLDIQRYLQDEPVSARPPSTSYGRANRFSDALADLARAYLESKRFAEAEALLRELLERARKSLRPESSRLADTLLLLGRCLVQRSNWIDAESVLREALPVAEKLQPGRSPVFIIRNPLGWALAGALLDH